MSDLIDLWDYRRRVLDLYASVRSAADPETGWRLWRQGRDRLFATHPQSPVEPDGRGSFPGVPYFDYDPQFRVTAEIEPAEPATFQVGHSSAGSTPMTRFGRVVADLPGGGVKLSLYWLDAYGGGVFLPFRDGTSGSATYGGGRYLLDTVKGADLGSHEGRLILDFNFAYHPSCVHADKWSCPLAPPENTTSVGITAGERLRRTP